MIRTKKRIVRTLIPYLLRKGDFFYSKHFIFRLKENTIGENRYACIISKKLEKKAFKRNRLKRRIYEAIRQGEKKHVFKNNFDIVLIPKQSSKNKTFLELYQDLWAKLSTL